MKFPTIILGIPQVSRRIVTEKQQLMKPSSLDCPDAVAVPFGVGERVARTGLYRRTHEVRTAFCFVSNAIWPYFYNKEKGISLRRR
jgi:hypothetical protein